jgi:methyl-accepting chemotaxis protein
MATRTRKKMGHDPLADKQETPEAGEDSSNLKGLDRRTTATRRRNTRRKVDNEVSPEQAEAEARIALLENSFALLAGSAEQLVARFYEELFERYPAVVPMFDGADMSDQQKKLLAALKLVVNSLRNPDKLVGALTQLGRKHRDYGAQPEHYGAVAETLLDVMAEFAGNAWTEDVKQAWTGALNQVAEVMIKAGTTETDMATSKKVVRR